MLTIGICDDDSVFSEHLYQIINHVMFPISDWKSRIFHTGSEVIEAIENGTFDCQLIFMDIMMGDGEGFQTAQYICKHKLNTDLIFVTASKEHVFECYHYHAFACDSVQILRCFLAAYYFIICFLFVDICFVDVR